MIDLKEWIDRNALRPLVYAIGTVLCLQSGYLAYLAHDEYAAQLHRIDRVTETASLGLQQNNRPLIESVLITGLHNSDAASVALCRDSQASLIYPPTSVDPCRPSRRSLFQWTVRRRAVGLRAYEFVFVINWFQAFSPFAVWLGVTIVLSLATIRILSRARRQFQAEILDPLRQGLNEDRPLAIFELDELRRRNQAYNAMSRRQAVSEALFELSAQVAHDIRSPLAALEIASEEPAAHGRLIKDAVGRIRDIANSLLGRHRSETAASVIPATSATAVPSSEAAEPRLLSDLIGPVVSEKRIQMRSIASIRVELTDDGEAFGLFAQVQPAEFQRVLSNLLNNAVEALRDEAGSVFVGLTARNGKLRVSVQDDGRGIPPEILAQLGRRGVSFGKTDGSGLGLNHARACAEAWGGCLEISSELGKGSTVTLELPKAVPPDWFAAALTMRPGDPLIVLDDDESIHQLWRKRLGAVSADEAVVHLYKPDALRDWVSTNASAARRALYLLDYELSGYKETGLSLAEELGIGERAVLVTSRHGETRVLDDARRLKVRILPKELARWVPLHDGRPSPDIAVQRWDAVLIDDDPLTQMTWEVSATKTGRKIRVFATVAAFLDESAEIARDTPVYVDSRLADGVEGEKESLLIRERGFDEIYLATGRPPAEFAGVDHVRAVVGKEPPWKT